MPPAPFLRHIFCLGLILPVLPSCEKAQDSTREPIAPSPKPPTETSAMPSSSAEGNQKTAPSLSAQQKLEAQSYYTGENIAAATALIENLSPATRQLILDKIRQPKKIDAVKVIFGVETSSLAVAKLAVEMIAISEGLDPGIY